MRNLREEPQHHECNLFTFSFLRQIAHIQTPIGPRRVRYYTHPAAPTFSCEKFFFFSVERFTLYLHKLIQRQLVNYTQ